MADQGTEGLLSPYLRRKRLEAVIPFLRGNILDFGCGTGALATFVDANKYLGVEINTEVLQQANSRFPEHNFITNLTECSDKFDTIVSLAVIEHISDPVQLLLTMSSYLRSSSKSRLVLTTPHPFVDWIHGWGAAIGIFSKCANEEHESLLGRSKLETVGKQAGLRLIFYHRFLFGANQIAVYSKGSL